MINVFVCDKATYFEEVKKLGREIVELDIYENPLSILLKTSAFTNYLFGLIVLR